MTARRYQHTRPAPRLERGEDWREYAACQWQDPELFFAPGDEWTRHREQEAAAKAVCAACPVRALCLAAALAEGDGYAIRGGTSPNERRAIIRRRTRTANHNKETRP